MGQVGNKAILNTNESQEKYEKRKVLSFKKKEKKERCVTLQEC